MFGTHKGKFTPSFLKKEKKYCKNKNKKPKI